MPKQSGALLDLWEAVLKIWITLFKHKPIISVHEFIFMAVEERDVAQKVMY